MDFAVLNNPPYDAPFRLGVIDGSELNPVDSGGGRIVCFDGDGNQPLFMVTIDETFAKCQPTVTEIPVIPPTVEVPTPAIPEPATYALLALGLLGVAGWKRVRG